MTKFTKRQFVELLLTKNLTDDEMIEAIMAGSEEHGIKPEPSKTFAKLQLRKYRS